MIGKKNSAHDNIFHYGLSEKDALRKLKEHGPNILTGKKKKSAISMLLEQFRDMMVIILLISTVVSAFMGELTEAVTIIAIVIINAILGFIQEYRTEKTMDALKKMAAPTARVIREARQLIIQADQVVPGDLILLEAGDRIPADAYLISATNLLADESLLTGESVPVEKKTSKASEKEYSHTSSSRESDDRQRQVYMGTVATSGRGRAIVHSTGMSTEMGKIAGLIGEAGEDATPLQKKLDHMGRFIAAGCLIICTIVSVTGILRGEDFFNMLLAGISLAVAAVPEGLPAIVTVSLALGVRRMLGRNALVRKLPAVETLGCASVICSDKTGTLTENKMSVRKIYTGGNEIILSAAKDAKGSFSSISQGRIDPLSNHCLRMVLEAGALCNNATSTEGDPTEAALVVAAAKAGLEKGMLDSVFFRIDELPFDSERKCMTVVCVSHKKETWIFTKGAPDLLLQKCAKVLTGRGEIPLDNFNRREILKQNDKMASEALRVIGMAYKKSGASYKNESSACISGDTIEKDLVFAGLAGMIDPPRKEALDSVRKCKMAGIRPVMITGDHRLTAAAIAGELEILEDKRGIISSGKIDKSVRNDSILTGDELEKLSDDELQKLSGRVSVYARVTPKHKLSIVKALKKEGHIVAMTGDGVNDAPAVKEADIGVAMGLSGTDVTREASSMVLMDDNFSTIVSAVEEGRVIYSNIRKFIRYMLACNIGEVLVMFLGMLAGFPVPLLPIQILWVNLVTDGLPAVALGFDPPEKDVMLQKPRGATENIFSNGLLGLILLRGVLIGLTTLAVFAIILFTSGNTDAARTGAFATLVLTQLIHVFECKSEKKSIFDIPVLNNIYLILAVLSSLVMIMGVLYLPVLQGIFHTVHLGMPEWLIIIGLCAIGPVAASFFRIKHR